MATKPRKTHTIHTATGPKQVGAGDRVWRWVSIGSDGRGYETADIQELTIVRVNRVTFTVDSKDHGRGRVPLQDITGIVDW